MAWSMDALVAALPGQHKDVLKSAGPVLIVGNFASLWSAAGNPGAGVLAIGAGNNGAIPTDATAGAIPITDAPAGQELRLAQVEGGMQQPGSLFLYDRLWHGGSYATTALGATAVAPPALTRPDALGEDTELWVEVVTAPAAASTLNVTYTNSAGTAGRTTGATASLIGFAVGRMVPLPFQSGDVGIRAVTSVTIGGTAGAGTFNLLIIRRIASVKAIAANVVDVLDAFRLGFPRVYNDSCLAAMILPSAVAWPFPFLDFAIVAGAP